MTAHCCQHETPQPAAIANLASYRRILWIALVVNAAMFRAVWGALSGDVPDAATMGVSGRSRCKAAGWCCARPAAN
jgi:hypothetical protein